MQCPHLHRTKHGIATIIDTDKSHEHPSRTLIRWTNCAPSKEGVWNFDKPVCAIGTLESSPESFIVACDDGEVWNAVTKTKKSLMFKIPNLQPVIVNEIVLQREESSIIAVIAKHRDVDRSESMVVPTSSPSLLFMGLWRRRNGSKNSWEQVAEWMEVVKDGERPGIPYPQSNYIISSDIPAKISNAFFGASSALLGAPGVVWGDIEGRVWSACYSFSNSSLSVTEITNIGQKIVMIDVMKVFPFRSTSMTCAVVIVGEDGLVVVVSEDGSGPIAKDSITIAPSVSAFPGSVPVSVSVRTHETSWSIESACIVGTDGHLLLLCRGGTLQWDLDLWRAPIFAAEGEAVQTDHIWEPLYSLEDESSMSMSSPKSKSLVHPVQRVQPMQRRVLAVSLHWRHIATLKRDIDGDGDGDSTYVVQGVGEVREEVCIVGTDEYMKNVNASIRVQADGAGGGGDVGDAEKDLCHILSTLSSTFHQKADESEMKNRAQLEALNTALHISQSLLLHEDEHEQLITCSVFIKGKERSTLKIEVLNGSVYDLTSNYWSLLIRKYEKSSPNSVHTVTCPIDVKRGGKWKWKTESNSGGFDVEYVVKVSLCFNNCNTHTQEIDQFVSIPLLSREFDILDWELDEDAATESLGQPGASMSMAVMYEASKTVMPEVDSIVLNLELAGSGSGSSTSTASILNQLIPSGSTKGKVKGKVKVKVKTLCNGDTVHFRLEEINKLETHESERRQFQLHVRSSPQMLPLLHKAILNRWTWLNLNPSRTLISKSKSAQDLLSLNLKKVQAIRRMLEVDINIDQSPSAKSRAVLRAGMELAKMYNEWRMK